jgi:hypothetical protein
MRLFLRKEKDPYAIIPEDEKFAKQFDEVHDHYEEDNASEDEIPRTWAVRMAKEGQAPQDSTTQTLAPGGSQEKVIYPKGFTILQNMGFTVKGVLGKEGQGITEVPKMEERPKGLELGATPDALVTKKRDAVC